MVDTGSSTNGIWLVLLGYFCSAFTISSMDTEDFQSVPSTDISIPPWALTLTSNRSIFTNLLVVNHAYDDVDNDIVVINKSNNK